MKNEILLAVDDKPDNLFALEQVIGEYCSNCKIITAQSAEKGLAQALKNPPDVAVIDVQMPGMNGIEMCRRLKSDKSTANIPVILLTAHRTTPQIKTEALNAGADEFISKPIDNAELVARIRVMLRIKKAEDTLRLEKDRLEDAVRERTKQLQESNERYLAMFENMLNGVSVFKPVKNGENFIIVDFNKAAEQIEKIKKQDIIGKKVLDVFPGMQESGLLKVFRDVNKTGKAEHYPVFMYKDDRLSGWRENLVYKLPSGEIVAIYSDETEQMMTKLELVDSEIRYRTLFDNANDAIFVRDFDGKILDVNLLACEYLGYTREELIQMSTDDIIDPKQAPFVQDRLKKLREIGSLVFETSHKRKDGDIVPIESSSCVIEYAQKPFMLTIARDISERRQAEQERAKLQNQLRQAQKMQAIGTLAGGIAHDFNNILFPIIGYIEMTMDDVPEGRALRNLKEVLKSANRARELIQQILTFSRQSDQELRPLRIESIIKEALRLLRSSIPATIKIRQRVERCGLIMADPTQIHQIIMNLCTNAYHAMIENGGVLEVTMNEMGFHLDDISAYPDMKPGLYLKVTVSDTGCGIKKDIIERVFDPYFTTKEKGKGTGLGLSVVHGIVKSHSGHITVSSNPGVGTAFNVYLPMIETDSSPQEKVAEEPLRGGNERILLVDDEKQIVEMETQMLERLGYKVTALKSSPEALDIFSKNPKDFDLVITDMTMPEMTGMELSRNLMLIRPDIPIILCTGFNEIITEEKAKSIGIREFVMKPVLRSKIAKIIRQILESNEK
ncbi:MAG: response regulator [Desulfobacterales bacterium]|nr:response regulator [Desulfobacterales bacterium]